MSPPLYYLAMKKLLDVARYNPRDSKRIKNQLLESRSILAVDEKVISFLILFTRQYQLAKEKLLFLRVSAVRILSSDAVHKKKATRGGALTIQTLLQRKELSHLIVTEYNDSSL
jgi:hypothetical protein